MTGFRYDDTIFALATPPVAGALAVFRISGPGSRSTAERLLRSERGHPITLESHRVHPCRLVDPTSKSLVDEVIILYMARPRSFTREDVVEIQCHGSLAVIRRIQSMLRREGLRDAEPGEFTRRAFLNGRIGLTEAEGIHDLVRASTEASAGLALEQMHGSLRTVVSGLRRELLDITALIEANIDFPEDDIDILDREKLEADVVRLRSRIEDLLATYARGRRIRDGIVISISGRPNAGKSSLLNLLLKHERAIVSSVPGTTRDVIEEAFEHRGHLYRVIDTAGLRSTEDAVESMGIERARETIARADLVIYLIDQSSGVHTEDRGLLAGLDPGTVITVLNKADRPSAIDASDRESLRGQTVELCALDGTGVEALLAALHEKVQASVETRGRETLLTNARHRDALAAALDSLGQFHEAYRGGIPLDVALLDLYETTRALGLIVGEIVTEDILDHIFAHFCIGK